MLVFRSSGRPVISPVTACPRSSQPCPPHGHTARFTNAGFAFTEPPAVGSDHLLSCVCRGFSLHTFASDQVGRGVHTAHSRDRNTSGPKPSVRVAPEVVLSPPPPPTSLRRETTRGRAKNKKAHSSIFSPGDMRLVWMTPWCRHGVSCLLGTPHKQKSRRRVEMPCVRRLKETLTIPCSSHAGRQGHVHVWRVKRLRSSFAGAAPSHRLRRTPFTTNRK